MIKTLKRFLLFLGIFIILTGTCFGAERQFKGGEISLSFPEGWEVVDEESITEESARSMGWTEEELTEFFEDSGNILLSEKKVDKSNCSLSLCYSSQIFDEESEIKESYKDKELLSFHKSYGAEYLKDMFHTKPIGKATIFQGKNENFVKVLTASLPSEHGTYYSQRYYTIKNETLICFQIGPATDQLTGRQISEGEAVISSFQENGYYDTYEMEIYTWAVMTFGGGLCVVAAMIAGIRWARRARVRARRKRAVEALSGQQDYDFDHDWGDEPAHPASEPAQENVDWEQILDSKKATKIESRKVDI